MGRTRAIALSFAFATLGLLVMASGCTSNQEVTTSEVPGGPASTGALTTTASAVTTTSLAATTTVSAPGPITAGDIKNLAQSYSAFTPDEIQVVEFQTFGDWAVAYVTAEQADTPLVVFTRTADGWVVFDIGTGLGPDDLRSEGVPQEVIDWAFTSGPYE